MKKEISVLMAVYKESLQYLQQSIESTIESLGDISYEFIIVVDNPQLDISTLSYLEEIDKNNPDVTLVFNEINVGLAASLNMAISKANSNYMMRMDADDICDKMRVKEQLNYIKKNNLDLVGCNIHLIDEYGERIGVRKSQRLNDSEVDSFHVLKFRTICFHPTWLGKAELFKRIRYNEYLRCAQDVDFLYRVLDFKYKVGNVESYLLDYRLTQASLSGSKGYEQIINRISINEHYINNSHSNRSLLDIISENKKKYSEFEFNRFQGCYSDALLKKSVIKLGYCILRSPLHRIKFFMLLGSKLNAL